MSVTSADQVFGILLQQDTKDQLALIRWLTPHFRDFLEARRVPTTPTAAIPSMTECVRRPSLASMTSPMSNCMVHDRSSDRSH